MENLAIFDIVSILNDELYGDSEEKHLSAFSYSSDGYSESVLFGNEVIWTSEDDLYFKNIHNGEEYLFTLEEEIRLSFEYYLQTLHKYTKTFTSRKLIKRAKKAQEEEEAEGLYD